MFGQRIRLFSSRDFLSVVARVFTGGLAIVGLLLLALSIAGLFIPLRAPDITENYSDFARVGTLSYDEAEAELAALRHEKDPVRLVTEATHIFQKGIAHLREDDLERRGLEHYRLVIPIWENWLLYGLDYLKPDYLEDGYHFCNYHRALKRGVGWCEQKSMALTGYLREQGLETGIVDLGGHVIATARVGDGGWYLLDPDYGGVIPFDLDVAQASPERVIPYYWSQAASDRHLSTYYGEDGNHVDYGGPEVRYPKACPIEMLAYALKWTLPLGMLLPFGLGRVRRGRKRNRPD